MKVAGIVGGMGSLSTVDFLQKVVERTKAEKDQDHIRMVVDFNTAVPDRTTALLHGGEDPTPYLVDSVKRLEMAGADFAVFICNTAHAFLEKVQEQSNIPVLSLPELAVERLRKKGIGEAWLTGTKGLIKSGVYQKAAQKVGMILHIPNSKIQDHLMQIIYSVKAGELSKAEKIWYENVEPSLGGSVLLGCTELPVVAKSQRFNVIDLNMVWAEIVIELCGGKLK
ncbi:cysteate racemase [Thermotoga profunda]|uniref:aspartate/glutamate racemase family protein n=1 Tax=Thermotoga profunda TaxID=1508420 RepID=UPI000597C28E|nr:amino acid racemase [Thermotoga profunda]